MASKGAHVNVSSYMNEEHDHETYRKRVATHIDGNNVVYEDTDFAVGDDGSILQVYTDLGRLGLKGSFINDGPGNMKIEVSEDGTTYGGIQTIRAGEIYSLDDLKINKIRLTYVDPAAYRVQIG